MAAIERRREQERQQERQQELLREQERQRQKVEEDQRRQVALKRIGLCEAGYVWNKVSGGYRCAGGSHFCSDSEIERYMR